MKARINTFALQQTCMESAKLGALCTVAHTMNNEGKYAGTVYQQGRKLTSFRLSVDKKADNTQIDIDLSALEPRRRRSEEPQQESSFSVAPQGYLVLYVSEGRGDYHVRLDRLGGRRRQRVFDSRNLQAGDIFIISPLRPGTYAMTSKHADEGGSLTVSYPKIAKTPYSPAQPKSVRVTEKGFEPAKLAIGPAQGVVFTVEAEKVALKVDCSKPDDGPDGKGKASQRFRWENPSAA